MVLAGIGTKLDKAGDPANAREVIGQAHRVASEFTRLEDKEGATPYVAEAMAGIGDLDGALTLARALGKHGRYSAFQMIIKTYTEATAGVGPNLDGIRITSGAVNDSQGSHGSATGHAQDRASCASLRGLAVPGTHARDDRPFAGQGR